MLNETNIANTQFLVSDILFKANSILGIAFSIKYFLHKRLSKLLVVIDYTLHDLLQNFILHCLLASTHDFANDILDLLDGEDTFNANIRVIVNSILCRVIVPVSLRY
jgi:hypothetical protein